MHKKTHSSLLFTALGVAVASGCGSSEQPANTTSTTGEAHEGHEQHTAHAEAEEAAGPAPTRVLEDGSRLFGAELVSPGATSITDVALAQLAANPGQWNSQMVQTEGTIARVCQQMGCWMELQADGVEPVRVPMAGHAFFLPRDVAGHTARVVGTVRMQELSEAERAHLEGEGAVATRTTFSIDATSVVVR